MLKARSRSLAKEDSGVLGFKDRTNLLTDADHPRWEASLDTVLRMVPTYGVTADTDPTISWQPLGQFLVDPDGLIGF